MDGGKGNFREQCHRPNVKLRFYADGGQKGIILLKRVSIGRFFVYCLQILRKRKCYLRENICMVPHRDIHIK